MGRIGSSVTRAANDANVAALQKKRTAKLKVLKTTDNYGKRAGTGIKRA